ncbi:MAG: hypothetical protein HY901_17110 [Deltaproteobacteria bacterium]|nr:hypothetical protein [Deltaproteobacteria bacterium]
MKRALCGISLAVALLTSCNLIYDFEDLPSLDLLPDAMTAAGDGGRGSDASARDGALEPQLDAAVLRRDAAMDRPDASLQHQFTLEVTVVGTGEVTVSRDGNQMGRCTGGVCPFQIAANAFVKLVPSSTAPFRFYGWEGSCVGPGDCEFQMKSNVSTTARFGTGFRLGLRANGPQGDCKVAVTLPSGASDEVSCGGERALDVPQGGAVTLEGVSLKKNALLSPWNPGPCWEQGQTCTFNLDRDVFVEATFNAYNYIFVTSAPVNGFIQSNYSSPLTGRDAADAICNEEAGQAGLAGNYLAWLPGIEPEDNVADRFIARGARGWVRTDGRPVLNALGGQYSPQIFYPPRLNAKGERVDGPVLTGSLPDGKESGDTCQYWTSTSGNGVLFGDSSGGTVAWLTSYKGNCLAQAHLYCLGTDINKELVFAREKGKSVFLAPTGSADSVSACQSAKQGSVPLQSTLASSGIYVLNGKQGPWIRPDGIVAIGPSLVDGLVAPIEVGWDGRLLPPSRVWTGSMLVTKPSLAEEGCNGWSDTGYGVPAIVGASNSVARFWNAGPVPSPFFLDSQSIGSPTSCNETNNTAVYCIEP